MIIMNLSAWMMIRVLTFYLVMVDISIKILPYYSLALRLSVLTYISSYYAENALSVINRTIDTCDDNMKEVITSIYCPIDHR